METGMDDHDAYVAHILMLLTGKNSERPNLQRYSQDIQCARVVFTERIRPLVCLSTSSRVQTGLHLKREPARLCPYG